MNIWPVTAVASGQSRLGGTKIGIFTFVFMSIIDVRLSKG